jgi:outer membrane protein assembly factor BamB
VGTGDATPALVGDKLYVFTRQDADEVTRCLDAGNGKELWQDKYTAQIVTGPAGRHPGPRSSPVVSDGKVITLGVGGKLSCLDMATGKVMWRKDEFTQAVPAYFTGMSPIIDGQTVIYTGQGGGTRAVKVSGTDVRELWHNEELGTAYNTPVLKDGYLYGLSHQGRFFCLNAGTGKVAWKDEGSHKNFGAILDAGSVILALPSDSELIAFKPDSKEYTELFRMKVSDNSVYAHPVVAGNRIYVKDQETLTLWTIE